MFGYGAKGTFARGEVRVASSPNRGRAGAGRGNPASSERRAASTEPAPRGSLYGSAIIDPLKVGPMFLRGPTCVDSDQHSGHFLDDGVVVIRLGEES